MAPRSSMVMMPSTAASTMARSFASLSRSSALARASSSVRSAMTRSSSAGLFIAMRVGQARRSDQAVHHETIPVAIRTWPESRYIGWKNASMSRKWPSPHSANEAGEGPDEPCEWGPVRPAVPESPDQHGHGDVGEPDQRVAGDMLPDEPVGPERRRSVAERTRPS